MVASPKFKFEILGRGLTDNIYDQNGKPTTFTYNNFSQILTITGAPGNTTNSYDAKDNLLATTA